jgi:small subunit ribosomal protein S14
MKPWIVPITVRMYYIGWNLPILLCKKKTWRRQSRSAILACLFPTFRPNARVLRDIKARQGVAENEISRRAYLYVARNQSLPAQVRYQAQLQLNAFGRYTRPTTVKNRCAVTGRGRCVMGEFGLCRVSESVFFCCVPCADSVTCGGSTDYSTNFV